MKPCKIPRWLWYKKYLETGMSITKYFLYMIALLGITGLPQNLTITLGLVYGLSSVLIGWLWVKYRLVDYENEINNILNPFQKEVRRKLGKKSRFKI